MQDRLADQALTGVRPSTVAPRPFPESTNPFPEVEDFGYTDLIRSYVEAQIRAQEARDRQAAFLMWGVHF